MRDDRFNPSPGERPFVLALTCRLVLIDGFKTLRSLIQIRRSLPPRARTVKATCRLQLAYRHRPFSIVEPWSHPCNLPHPLKPRCRLSCRQTMFQKGCQGLTQAASRVQLAATTRKQPGHSPSWNHRNHCSSAYPFICSERVGASWGVDMKPSAAAF